MLQIHGTKDDSSEYAAAEILTNSASKAMPDIEHERNLVLHIFPSIQCFGQKFQDIDLLVMFADYRDNEKTNNVHSLLCKH